MKVLLASACLLLAAASLADAACTAKYKTFGKTFCFWGAITDGSGFSNASTLPTDVCTHVVLSYLAEDAVISDLAALKEKNPNLKLIYHIPENDNLNITAVASDSTLKKEFIVDMVDFLIRTKFDGINVGWGVAQIDSTSNKYHYLLRDMKRALNYKGFELSILVGATPDIVSQFDIETINKYVDNILMMTYSYHNSFLDEVTGANAPLYPQLTDDSNNVMNVNHSVHLFLDGGATASKLILGVATFSNSFTLKNHLVFKTGSPASGVGASGAYTKMAGMFAYYEICHSLQTARWATTEVTGSYVYGSTGKLWAGYENTNTIYAKGAYAKSLGLGGVFVDQIDYDDHSGICSTTTFPLTRSVKNGYLGVTTTSTTTATES